MAFPFAPFPSITTSIHAPFSGDVSQNIEPRVFSPDIAGDAEAEYRIHRNVASYGTQLGKILDALEVLSEATGTDLPEIDALIAGVKAEKETHRETLRREAQEALARLKAVDERAWKGVVKGD